MRKCLTTQQLSSRASGRTVFGVVIKRLEADWLRCLLTLHWRSHGHATPVHTQATQYARYCYSSSAVCRRVSFIVLQLIPIIATLISSLPFLSSLSFSWGRLGVQNTEHRIPELHGSAWETQEV